MHAYTLDLLCEGTTSLKLINSSITRSNIKGNGTSQNAVQPYIEHPQQVHNARAGRIQAAQRCGAGQAQLYTALACQRG